jgi:hypothetical protein
MEPTDPKKVIHLNSEIMAAVPVEDRIWLYWQKAKQPILFGALAVLLGFAGYKGYEWFQAKRLQNIQETYLNSLKNNERLAFAKTYPNEPLAGVALMEEGFAKQDASEWAAAAEAFEHAVAPLKGSPLQAQAKLQQAKCLVALKNQDQAIVLFEGVFNDAEAFQSFRAEAAYERALIALEMGDNPLAKSWLEKIETLEQAGFWTQKAQSLPVK